MADRSSLEEGYPPANEDHSLLGHRTEPWKRWKSLCIKISIIILIILAGIILDIALFADIFETNEDPKLVIARNGAVSAEQEDCSKIGVQILKEGGSAVDAAIASELCIGTINAFSAGIGGGGFMIIRDSNGTAEVIDFRETAPAAANKTMFNENPKLAAYGGLAVGVP
ncbi:hypothetical protein RclHR1_03250006 [Rhizophagus clarus]|nr:hypothetical protein RclHR1_03250006 [Rhizophagus clarus]